MIFARQDNTDCCQNNHIQKRIQHHSCWSFGEKCDIGSGGGANKYTNKDLCGKGQHYKHKSTKRFVLRFIYGDKKHPQHPLFVPSVCWNKDKTLCEGKMHNHLCYIQIQLNCSQIFCKPQIQQSKYSHYFFLFF